MSDLVAFGCSNTYGHGLPDCFIPPMGHGPNPSNFAWPKLLANKLNRTCINNGRPGASNIQILWKLLNHSFKSNDVCVIMWTFFERITFSRLKLDPNFYYTVDLFSKNLDTKISLDELDEENYTIRNFVCIHHAKLFLESKDIKFIFLINANRNHEKFKLENLILDILPYGDQSFWRVDDALDGWHPGVKSHEKLADLLLNTNVLY